MATPNFDLRFEAIHKKLVGKYVEVLDLPQNPRELELERGCNIVYVPLPEYGVALVLRLQEGS